MLCVWALPSRLATNVAGMPSVTKASRLLKQTWGFSLFLRSMRIGSKPRSRRGPIWGPYQALFLIILEQPQPLEPAPPARFLIDLPAPPGVVLPALLRPLGDILVDLALLVAPHPAHTHPMQHPRHLAGKAPHGLRMHPKVSGHLVGGHIGIAHQVLDLARLHPQEKQHDQHTPAAPVSYLKLLLWAARAPVTDRKFLVAHALLTGWLLPDLGATTPSRKSHTTGSKCALPHPNAISGKTVLNRGMRVESRSLTSRADSWTILGDEPTGEGHESAGGMVPQRGVSRKGPGGARQHRRAQSKGGALPLPGLWQDLWRPHRHDLSSSPYRGGVDYPGDHAGQLGVSTRRARTRLWPAAADRPGLAGGSGPPCRSRAP